MNKVTSKENTKNFWLLRKKLVTIIRALDNLDSIKN